MNVTLPCPWVRGVPHGQGMMTFTDLTSVPKPPERLRVRGVWCIMTVFYAAEVANIGGFVNHRPFYRVLCSILVQPRAPDS